MATFFYESVWNLLVFFFLIIARRRWFRYYGDVFSFYAFLYACGRLIIEDFRLDSLYAASAVRISQVLSAAICILIFIRYLRVFREKPAFSDWLLKTLVSVILIFDVAIILWMTGIVPLTVQSVRIRFLILSACSAMNISSLLILYKKCAEGDIVYADVKK